MDINAVFTKIVVNREAISGVLPKAVYASRRVSLLRKFAAYRSQLQAIGVDSLDGSYIKASWNKETGVATFVLAEKASFIGGVGSGEAAASVEDL